VQVLWRTGRRQATAREVSLLWTAAPHFFQDASAPSTALGPPVHEYYLPGMVHASGTLCRSLQRALLCCNCEVPESLSPAALVSCCADALNEMRNAKQLDAVCIGGAASEIIRQLVREEMAG